MQIQIKIVLTRYYISVPSKNLVHSDCGDVVFLEIGSSSSEIYLVSTNLIWICIQEPFYILETFHFFLQNFVKHWVIYLVRNCQILVQNYY